MTDFEALLFKKKLIWIKDTNFKFIRKMRILTFLSTRIIEKIKPKLLCFRYLVAAGAAMVKLQKVAIRYFRKISTRIALIYTNSVLWEFHETDF